MQRKTEIDRHIHKYTPTYSFDDDEDEYDICNNHLRYNKMNKMEN